MYSVKLNITTDEFKENIKKTKTLILPVGSYEQHSKFMCMGTDTIVATYIAQELEKKMGAISLFPIVYGVSEFHKAFSGTVYVKPKNFYIYVKDIIESIAREKIDNLLIVNGHGANWFALNKVCEECSDLYSHIAVYQWWELIGEKYFSKEETSHAGAQELSVLQYINKKFVRLDKVENQEKNMDIDILDCSDIYQITKNGVIGTATTFNIETGEAICKEVIDIFSKIINDWESDNGNT